MCRCFKQRTRKECEYTSTYAIVLERLTDNEMRLEKEIEMKMELDNCTVAQC